MVIKKNKKTLKELREEQYAYNIRVAQNDFGIDLNNWRKNPYTFFKARFYMEASAVLVYLLLKTDIKPNTVTMVYGVAGIAGGILLAIPIKFTIVAAIVIFFLKGILDWSDGHLARITGQTSRIGHILDSYGSLLNILGLQIGLGFYVAQKADMMLFYYFIPLIPFFYAANPIHFSIKIIFDSYISAEEIKSYRNKNTIEFSAERKKKLTEISNNRFGSIYNFIQKIFDDRARSVDLICLVILMELYTQIFVTWFIFLFLLFKQFSVFCASFYAIVKGGWAEIKLNEKIVEIIKIIDQ